MLGYSSAGRYKTQSLKFKRKNTKFHKLELGSSLKLNISKVLKIKSNESVSHEATQVGAYFY